MSLEEQYLIHKKKELIKLVNIHNNRALDSDYFEITGDYADLDIEKTFCSSSSCKKCGACCKQFPCAFSPNDFLDINNSEYMSNILNTGLVVLAVSYNRKNIYLRPRGFADEKLVSTILLDSNVANGNNPCILHTKNGCLLEPQYRPSEGLLYIHRNYHIIMYTEDDYEREYDEYQESLFNLFYNYGNNYIALNQESIEENVKKLTRGLCGYKNQSIDI